MNTSATGGYLQPAFSPAPLEDAALYEFLQAAVVGITGLDGTLVRPRWQAEPSLLPTEGTAWCSIGVTDREADTYAYLGAFPDNAAGYAMQRHEEFTLLCSFYDLGYNGQADTLAALLRDGLTIPQNQETLGGGGIFLVSDTDLTPVPVLLKQRWQYRVDLAVRMRRQIDRNYPVLTLRSAQGTVRTGDGYGPVSFGAVASSAPTGFLHGGLYMIVSTTKMQIRFGFGYGSTS
jgi:hypothetical protein